jgi:hypothetical protein
MKKYITIFVLFLLACGVNLPDQYENIEKLRALAITFDNHGFSESAPGDTVYMRAYFSGDNVNTAHWFVSTQLISGIFGSDTFVDSVAMEKVVIPGTYTEYFAGKTDSIALSFKIPDDAIRKGFNLSKPVASLLPATIDDSLRKVLSTFTIGQVLDLLDNITQKPELLNPAMFSLLLGSNTDMSPEQLKFNMSILLQVFSTKIMISGLINDYYMVKTYQTVKYAAKMKRSGLDVEVNRVPVIDKVQLYKVSGDRNSFDPLGAEVKMVYTLNENTDTVYIEKGYSYFLKASMVDSLLDSGLDYRVGTRNCELYYYKWFFRNDDEVPGVAMDDLMKISQPTLDSNTVRLYPSLDKRMEKFSIWLSVYDDLFGVRLRPRGFTFKAMQGVFKYSTDY